MKTTASLSNVSQQIRSCTNPQIICHPENLRVLKDAFQPEVEKIYGIGNLDIYQPIRDKLYGIDIIEDASLPIFIEEWVFPADPFVTYEKADEK